MQTHINECGYANGQLMLNNVFLIGAMKCGTNTLYHALKNHPHIAIPETKELDYFVNQSNSSRYSSLFDIQSNTKITLDGTTQYSKYPAFRHMPEAIYAMNSHALIIYLMRDPVARIESNVAHQIARTSKVTLRNWRDFSGLHNIVNYSRYYTQIGLYATRFPVEQIFLGVFEEFVADQHKFIDRVCQFLDIEPSLIEIKGEKRNPKRPEHKADRLHFSEEEDISFASQLKNDIECLQHCFGIDVDRWWRRYKAAVRYAQV